MFVKCLCSGMSRRELSFYTPPSIFNKICACSCTRIHKVLTVIYSFMFKTLQLQRFIKFIGICHQLIVAEWLVLLATNLKVSGSSLTVTPGVFQGKFGRYIRK